jgi:hypothetical protein
VSYHDDKAIAQYVGGKVHDARVTVRWLEKANSDPVYYSTDFVQRCCEVWEDGNGDGTMPDHWQIDWFHFVDLITEGVGSASTGAVTGGIEDAVFEWTYRGGGKMILEEVKTKVRKSGDRISASQTAKRKAFEAKLDQL